MNKKELKQSYKLNPPLMGIYQIRNSVNNKLFVGSTLNLDGIFNRHRFQLNAGVHQNKLLQADWKELGEEKFVFEILEEIFPRENPGYDYKTDLEVLEDLWLEKLMPYDTNGYNERKKTVEERLRIMTEKRKNFV